MSKPIKWLLDLEITNNKDYEKLINFMSKSQFFTFKAEPNKMLDSENTHNITIYCKWTNNLIHLSKWIDKNISDEIK